MCTLSVSRTGVNVTLTAICAFRGTGYCHREADRRTCATVGPRHKDLTGVRCSAEDVVTDLCASNIQQSQEYGTLEWELQFHMRCRCFIMSATCVWIV